MTTKVFRTTPGTWIDPWGTPQAVNKVMQSRMLVGTAETHPVVTGYGPEHDYLGKVFLDEQDRRYVRVNPSDYGGRTYWSMIDPPDKKEAAKFWTEGVRLPAINRKGHPCDQQGVRLDRKPTTTS